MKYFVKLIYGGTYRTLKQVFELGNEVQVTEEDYDYFKKIVDYRLVDEDSGGRKVNSFPLFACRVEENTVEEKVAEEIKDAPDSLRPRRKKEAEEIGQ